MGGIGGSFRPKEQPSKRSRHVAANHLETAAAAAMRRKEAEERRLPTTNGQVRYAAHGRGLYY